MAGHIRQRSPGSWELRYSLGIDAGTGKRRVVSTTFHGTRKAAEKELRRLLHAVDAGEHVDPSKLVLRVWLATWLDMVHDEVSPRTHERYRELVWHFLAPALGNVPLTKLGPAHIQEAYNGWASGGRRDGKPGGLSPQTRRHLHRVLSAALARAVEQQRIIRNPCEVFRRRLPHVERREIVTLNSGQMQSLLTAIRHRAVYWPTLLAFATGARRGEVLAMRWRNVDLGSGVIRIVESLEQTDAGLRFKPPKNGKSRVVTLPRFAVDELRRLKREQAETLLLVGVRHTDETLLCGKFDGSPMPPRSLTHEFAKVAGMVKGVPRIRFHDIRHSHATELLSAGVHPKIAQERLGHSSINVTLDLYSHVVQTMQEDAAAKLDLAFRSATVVPRSQSG
jgi:integrase